MKLCVDEGQKSLGRCLIAGMILLVVVYYLGSGLVDPDVAGISKTAAIAIGLGSLAAGWFIYDVVVRSPVGQSQPAFAVFALIMTAARRPSGRRPWPQAGRR